MLIDFSKRIAYRNRKTQHLVAVAVAVEIDHCQLFYAHLMRSRREIDDVHSLNDKYSICSRIALFVGSLLLVVLAIQKAVCWMYDVPSHTLASRLQTKNQQQCEHAQLSFFHIDFSLFKSFFFSSSYISSACCISFTLHLYIIIITS